MKFFSRYLSVAALILALMAEMGQADTPTLVELTTADGVFQGASLWHDADACALLQLDGSIVRVPLADVAAFRQVSPRYRPSSVDQLKQQLRREFEHMNVESAGHSIVVAPDGMSRDLAELHHDTWSVYQDYFRRRDFDVSRNEMPFVTVVYPTFEEFALVAQSQNVRVSDTMKGYYHALTNRIIMFVPPEEPESEVSAALPFSETAFASIEDVDLLQTLAHEAVHQFAFNTGLHRRIGDNQRWIVEGLAMQFEGDTGLASNSSSRQQRMNRERYVWYVQSMLPRQEPELLASLISSDELFWQQPVDGYSAAWALTFFLMETQRADFVAYLQAQASLPPEQDLNGPQAIASFEEAFGDLEEVNDSFRRFMHSLN
jgi:hypothetical protein